MIITRGQGPRVEGLVRRAVDQDILPGPSLAHSILQGVKVTPAVASATRSPGSIELSARAPGLTAARKST